MLGLVRFWCVFVFEFILIMWGEVFLSKSGIRVWLVWNGVNILIFIVCLRMFLGLVMIVVLWWSMIVVLWIMMFIVFYFVVIWLVSCCVELGVVRLSVSELKEFGLSDVSVLWVWLSCEVLWVMLRIWVLFVIKCFVVYWLMFCDVLVNMIWCFLNWFFIVLFYLKGCIWVVECFFLVVVYVLYLFVIWLFGIDFI